MKTCSRCKEMLPKDAFYRNKSKADGLGTLCKPCANTASTEARRRTPEVHRKSAAKIAALNRTIVAAWKEAHPCADCGRYFPAYMMDFDHLSDKQFNISSGNRRSIGSLVDEIMKCEVVCCLCHRHRTYSRLKVYEITCSLPLPIPPLG